MIADSRERRLWRISLAASQAFVAISTFVLISFKIIPRQIADLVALFPPFSVGTFSSDLLLLALVIHILLIIFFGAKFWIRALGFAAQLAVILVFCSIALQSAFELVIYSIHKMHLDFWGMFDQYTHGEEATETLFAIAALQQPLFVTVVLPTALAVLYSIEALVDSCDIESFAVRHLRRESRFPLVGACLAGIYFFARCFNHVAHFVIPMTAQMLREERFEEELRKDFKHVIGRILLPEAVLTFVSKLVNRVGRTVCGSILLGIEYVPMWSTQVVSALLRGNHDTE
jgi:hypothetical protein